MKITLRNTEDGKSKQVVIEDHTDRGYETERLERSVNPNRAVSRGMSVISNIISDALVEGKTVTIDIE